MAETRNTTVERRHRKPGTRCAGSPTTSPIILVQTTTMHASAVPGTKSCRTGSWTGYGETNTYTICHDFRTIPAAYVPHRRSPSRLIQPLPANVSAHETFLSRSTGSVRSLSGLTATPTFPINCTTSCRTAANLAPAYSFRLQWHYPEDQYLRQAMAVNNIRRHVNSTSTASNIAEPESAQSRRKIDQSDHAEFNLPESMIGRVLHHLVRETNTGTNNTSSSESSIKVVATETATYMSIAPLFTSTFLTRPHRTATHATFDLSDPHNTTSPIIAAGMVSWPKSRTFAGNYLAVLLTVLLKLFGRPF